MKGLLTITLLSFVLLTSACSPLSAISTLTGLGGGGPSLEIEAVVGDKNQEVRVGDTAGTINKVEEIPMKYMLLMILGWVAPSPREIWRGFVTILPWKR
jgi:hypothetical protein